jgi:hypothetical protein
MATKKATTKTANSSDAKKGTEVGAPVFIPALNIRYIELMLVGKSILVTKNPRVILKQFIRDRGVIGASNEEVVKPGGRSKDQSKPYNPRKEWEDGRYIMADGRDGFPAGTIKKTLVATAYTFADISKTFTRGAIFVHPAKDDGYLVPIMHEGTKPGEDPYVAEMLKGEGPYGDDFEVPFMREDMVRIGGKGPGTGTPDVRWRPEYRNWKIPVTVEYEANLVSPATVINLFAKAGYHVGIGEWRPEKNGDWGRFSVEPI